MVRSTGWVALVAAGLFLVGGCARAAPAPGKAVGVVLPGGGVADPDGKVGYVPNTSGGIDALDLATGERLWATKEAAQPLLATKDRLYAQLPVKGAANQVRVVALDTTEKGKRMLESKPVIFPEWVSVGAGYGRSFASAARKDGDGLLLVWEARAWYAGGARPTPEIEKAARKSASGVARVDLKSGRVEVLEGDKVPEGTPRSVPAAPQSVKAGGRVYSATDKPADKPFQKKRFLQAADAGGKVLWTYEIKAPAYLPPLP